MSCRICRNNEGNKTHTAHEMMIGTRESFVYEECAACGTLQLQSPPSDLGKYYPKSYPNFQTANGSLSAVRRWIARSCQEEALFHHSFIGRIFSIRYTPDAALTALGCAGIQKQSSVLDVGCGGGILLHSLWEAGFPRLLGIDPFMEKSVLPAHLPFKSCRLEDIPISPKWDIIIFNHVFEHVPNPRETLIAAAERLSRGGACVVRIPLASSWAWTHYGTDWVQLDAPRHLFLLSTKAIAQLATDAGLRVESTVYDSSEFQFWGSEQYRRGIPLEDPRSHLKNPTLPAFTPAELHRFKKRALRLNEGKQGDQASFILRKA